MSDELMDRAHRALREERRDDAQAILINIIARQPENDEAWLMLSEALTDAAKQRECLERARSINPSNPAILRALERLAPALASAPVSEASAITLNHAPPSNPNPTTDAHADNTLLARAENNAAVITTPAPILPGTFDALLQHGIALAQKVMLTTDPSDTRTAGLELMNMLEPAAAQDAVHTRRWARTAGRGALVKYEKALSSAIAGLPRNDPLLPELLEQRQRALMYLRK